MINFHAGSLIVRIVADASRFHAGMLSASAGMSSMTMGATRAAVALSGPFSGAAARATTSVSLLNARIMTLGGTMSAFLTGPFALFGVAGTRAFANFDKGINDAIAAAGGVTDRVRREMEQSVFEIAMRSTTSPAELARAYYYSISAGLSIAQSQVTLPHLERFSVGGQLDISRASDMVTDIQFSLNLIDSDLARHERNFQRIVDVIAMASVRSNATIEQMAIALTNKSATAMRLFGISLEEGTAALMVYAQQGTKAEVAGERLSIVLRDLQAVNITARREWERYGLSVYDATGNMLPLADIISQLEDRMSGFNDEQKRALLLALQFPSRSVHALLPLLGRSRDIARYHQDLSENSDGFNRDISERMLRSFSAQMGMFWNKVVMGAIELGRQLAPMLASINRELEKMTMWWLSLSVSTRTGLVAFFAFLALSGPFAMLVSLVSSLVLPLFTITGLFSFLGSLLMTGGILIALAILMRNAGGVGRAFEQMSNWIGRALVVVGDFWRHFDQNMDILGEWLADNWRTIFSDLGVILWATLSQLSAYLRIAGIMLWNGIAGSLQDLFTTLWNVSRTFTNALANNFMVALPHLLELLASWSAQMLLVFVNLSALVLHIFKNLFWNVMIATMAFGQWFAGLFNRLVFGGKLIELLVIAIPILVKVFENMGEMFATAIRNGYIRILNTFLPANQQIPRIPMPGLMDGVGQGHQERFVLAVANIARDSRNIWENVWGNARNDFQNLIADDFRFPMAVNFQAGWDRFVAGIGRDWNAFVNFFDLNDFQFENAANSWSRAWTTAITDIANSNVFREVMAFMGGLQTPAPNFNFTRYRNLESLDYAGLRYAGIVGMGSSLTGAGGSLSLAAMLGNSGGGLIHDQMENQARVLAGLSANSMVNAAGLSTIAALASQFNNMRPLMRAGPMMGGSSMSGVHFQEISTRRFDLDGPYGLANTPINRIKVEDTQMHALTRQLIEGQRNPQPIVDR